MTDEPPAIGRAVGRYTLRALLGRGGMGEVYRAYDERLRRHVAIKRIRPDAGPKELRSSADEPSDSAARAEAARRARLEREARLTAQLGHPAIVQVFDIVEDDGGQWVVMELVSGSTLAALLDDGPLPLGTAVRHAVAVAGALAAAHRQSIVHRDLKVENVMLSESGQIKVLDFGLAKRVVPFDAEGDAESAQLSTEGQVMGTVRAMSPEQARGLPLDERSDLFSLGVLIYELVVGGSPFAGASPLDTLVQVTTQRHCSLDEVPELVGKVPAELARLVDQLLEKAPELRPASAAVVEERLAAIAATLPMGGGARREGEGARRRGEGRGEPQASTLEPTVEADKAKETAVLRAPAEMSPDPSPSPSPRPRPSPSPRPSPRSEPAMPTAASSAPRTRARRYLPWLAAALTAAALVIVAARALSPARSATPRPPSRSAGASSPSSSPSTAPPSGARRDPQAQLQRGMELLRDYRRPGAIDAAAAYFQNLLRDDESSAVAYAGLARTAWHRYLFTDESRDPMYLQQAVAAAERAVSLDPLLAAARTSYGLVLVERGELPAAEEQLQTALTLESQSADVHDAVARLRLAQERRDDAEVSYRRAIELDPGSSHRREELGALELAGGDHAEAIAQFEASIALSPDMPYGYSNLGAVYLLQGRYPEAAERFQQALKLRPSASLYSNLGTVLFAQGLYAPAASAYERALAMGGASNHHLYWGNLADAYRQLPDAADKAREHYDRAVALLDAELARAPKDVTLQSRRALYLAKRGDCARGASALTALAPLVGPRAAQAAPPYALFRVAVAHELCGARERALAALERALAAGFPAAELANDPELRALRADPAYHRMMQRRASP